MKMTPQLCTQSLVEASTNTLLEDRGRLLDLEGNTLFVCVCFSAKYPLEREGGWPKL